MASSAAGCRLLANAVAFPGYFKDLQDRRRQARVSYSPDEILLLCPLAVLADAEAIADIALFGCKKLDPPHRFRPLANGTPAHDHLAHILAVLKMMTSFRKAWPERHVYPIPRQQRNRLKSESAHLHGVCHPVAAAVSAPAQQTVSGYCVILSRMWERSRCHGHRG